MSNEEISVTKQPGKNSFDQTSGVNYGTRTSHYKDDIKYSRRCKSFCCSRNLAERITIAGLNKFWCCFDCCYSFVDKKLVNDRKETHERIEETEEWMRSCSCWPLPVLTITMCTIQLYYFVSISISAIDYEKELENSTLTWHPSHRDEYHR